MVKTLKSFISIQKASYLICFQSVKICLDQSASFNVLYGRGLVVTKA